jgi:hypothetical protein
MVVGLAVWGGAIRHIPMAGQGGVGSDEDDPQATCRSLSFPAQAACAFPQVE